MSAMAALKGYRTQFLYCLHYILHHQCENYRFRLEGKEDLDVLDKDGNLLFAIQINNLNAPVVLSDLLSEGKTSFLRRFTEKYPNSTPVLVSFGNISSELKSWKETKGNSSNKEKKIIQKYRLKLP